MNTINKNFIVFEERSHYIRNQEFQKWQSVVLKLLIVKCFENTGVSPAINI